MSNEPLEGRFFRCLVAASLQIDITAGEAAEVAALLRKGNISNQLAAIFEGFAGTPYQSELTQQPEEIKKADKVRSKNGVPQAKQNTANLFDDVKRRKINKSTLFSLLDRVNGQVSSSIQDDLSMREALDIFRKESSLDDWLLLTDLVNGNSSLDPFLARMVSR